MISPLNESKMLGSESLSFESPIPLYQQIADVLSADVASGRLAPGSIIGPEYDLQKRFQVSRVTLRQALGILVKDGLVVRKQGKGTFIEVTPLDFPFDALQGTTQLATMLGHVTNSRIIQMRQVQGNLTIRRALDVPKNSKLTQICRLDRAGNEPFALATIYLPEWIGSRLSRAQFVDKALYPLLEESLGIVATEAHQTIRADGATRQVAKILEIPEDAPILSNTRVTRDEQNQPIEYSVVQFRADAVQFSISLRRRMGKVDSPFRFEKQLLFR